MAGIASGEQWVSGEVNLNLRTGPGSDYRIKGALKTGDSLEVLERQKRWTHVRVSDGREGWVPAGFLSEEPPPLIRVEQLAADVSQLREQLEKATTEVTELSSRNESLMSRDGELTATNRHLDIENRDLKAGARWPEWITGASILAAGMVAGALLQSWSSRRPQPRIRF